MSDKRVINNILQCKTFGGIGINSNGTQRRILFTCVCVCVCVRVRVCACVRACVCVCPRKYACVNIPKCANRSHNCVRQFPSFFSCKNVECNILQYIFIHINSLLLAHHMMSCFCS